jgi:hypothetical protein
MTKCQSGCALAIPYSSLISIRSSITPKKPRRGWGISASSAGSDLSPNPSPARRGELELFSSFPSREEGWRVRFLACPKWAISKLLGNP